MLQLFVLKVCNSVKYFWFLENMELFSNRTCIINNLDFFVDSTDKLLNQWRSKFDDNPKHIFLNTRDQCQRIILSIFGFIGFNYDL